MTWGEYQIRSHGYKRLQENEWRKVRKVAYNAMIGSHLNHKKIAKTEVKWLPIGDEIKVQEATETHREKYLNAWAVYAKKKQNG